MSISDFEQLPVDTSYAVKYFRGMSEAISARFLAELWRLQKEAGLTNAQLARDIDSKRSYISRVKAEGQNSNISYEFALRAARQFPELKSLLDPVVLEITEKETTINRDVSETEEAQ